jgi:hypothetical protein
MMNKDQLKAMLIELITDGTIDIGVNGYSTDYSHSVTVSLKIDGESYIESEVQLERG